MKKYKFLILFITLFSLLSFTKVFAQSNYNTNYELTIYSFSSLEREYTINNEVITPLDVIDELSSLESNYYKMLIYSSFSSVSDTDFSVYLIPKSVSTLYMYFGGTNREIRTGENNAPNRIYYGLNFSSSDFSTKLSNLKKCYTTNSSCNSVNSSITDRLIKYNTGPLMNNDNSYSWSIPSADDSVTGMFPVYSELPLKISNNYLTSAYLYKNIIINGTTYTKGDYFPTYLDLFPYENNDFDINKELDNYNSLSNFYFRINKNDISNFSFTYEFNPLYALSLVISNPNYFDDFYNDLGVGIKYFGRKYDSTNNYYTYDEINCSLNHTYIKNSNTINSNGTNLTCSTDLTDYDYIYLYIDQYLKSNDSINPTIKYVNLQVNGASYHYGDYIGFIYDRFDNLSSDFEMSFSSNETGFSSVYSNIDYGLIAEKVRVNNSEGFVPTALTIQPLEFSYDYKAYFVVFNDSNKYNGARNIEFFTFPNTIISFSDKENNKFYIYDENKNINSVTARIQYFLNDTSSYDLNYYFKQVNDYINGLSVQITNLGNLTQNFYDNMPDFVQTFIFIAFILACIYFTYKLIKK